MFWSHAQELFFTARIAVRHCTYCCSTLHTLLSYIASIAVLYGTYCCSALQALQALLLYIARNCCSLQTAINRLITCIAFLHCKYCCLTWHILVFWIANIAVVQCTYCCSLQPAINRLNRFHLLQILKGDYTLTFDPSEGYLDPRKEMSIKLTFTGHKKVGLNFSICLHKS